MSRRGKKSHKFSLFLCFISNILLFVGSGYLIYNVSLLNNVENDLRLIGSCVLIFVCLILLLLSTKFYRKHKNVMLGFVIIFMLIIGIGAGFAGYLVSKGYGTLEKISDTTGYKTYSSSLVTLAGNKASSLKDIGDDELGMIDDESSIEGYTIPKSIIKAKNLSNKVKKYTTFIEMIDALYKGEINYAFLPTNYSIMFGSMDGYNDIKDKTKIIYTKKKKVKEKTSYGNRGKSMNDPFTILLMGVDSEQEGIKESSFNGDSLMVITFNPKTLSTTMLSIPRDSYVPISCFAGKRKNKITHAAWQGEQCMINTIQDLLDVDIDYYVKINFKGVVKLVDTLGGVDIDVPYNMCEQDSNRAWGKNTVYIEKGQQVLNGEQALAYSRNRHPNPDKCSAKWTNYNSSDFVRAEHQQEVVTALLNKVKGVKNLDTVYKLLDTISNNMVTNMSTNQMLSLYNVFKDVATRSGENKDMADVLGIQRLYLNGYDARIIDYGGSNLSLYNYVLYNASVKACSNAMKENLGLKDAKTVKSFSFDINKPYEKAVIGKDVKDKTSIVLLPNFVGQSSSYAQSWCSSHGVKVSINGGNGYVTNQSVPAGANVEDVKSLVLTVGGSRNDTKTETKNQQKEPAKKETNTVDDKKDTTDKKDETPSTQPDSQPVTPSSNPSGEGGETSDSSSETTP